MLIWHVLDVQKMVMNEQVVFCKLKVKKYRMHTCDILWELAVLMQYKTYILAGVK